MIEITDDMAIYIPKHKVGSTVWFIDDYNHPIQGTVMQYSVYKKEGKDKIYFEYKVVQTGTSTIYTFGNNSYVYSYERLFSDKEKCEKAFILKNFGHLFKHGLLMK